MWKVPGDMIYPRFQVVLPPGFYLEEGEDILCLFSEEGKEIGRFSATGVTPEDIKRAVEDYLKNK